MRSDPVLSLQGKVLLIFDFDGTVADTSPLHAQAFSEVLAPFRVRVNYESIAGLNTVNAMRMCVSAAGVELANAQLEELVLAKQRLVRQLIARELRPMPGVDTFLRWARPRYRLSVATSGSRGTVEIALSKLGYDHWFDPLVCAEDVLRSKPDPDVFLRVLALTGCPPDKALVFEDSEAGFASARAAGIHHIDVRGFDWLGAQTNEVSDGY
jgi:HAD superfamily hydrolase (TIGR01509 family)